ncbi:MAG: hypothetical protein MHMPM18_002915 [Marteilia pararefringens]
MSSKPSRVFGIFSSLIDTFWRFKGILYENLHSLQHLIKGSNSIAKLLERIFTAFGSNDDLSAALRFLNELTELRPEENELRDPFTLKFIRAFQNLELSGCLEILSDATTTLLSQNNQEMLYKVMKRLRVERAPDLPSYLNDTLDSLEIKGSSLSKSFDYFNEISFPDSAIVDVDSSQYQKTVDKNSSGLTEQIESQKLNIRHNGSKNLITQLKHFTHTLWLFALICCNYLSPRKRIVTFAFENRSRKLNEFLVVYRKNFDSLQPDNSIVEVLKNLEDLTAIGMVDIDSYFRSIQ